MPLDIYYTHFTNNIHPQTRIAKNNMLYNRNHQCEWAIQPIGKVQMLVYMTPTSSAKS